MCIYIYLKFLTSVSDLKEEKLIFNLIFSFYWKIKMLKDFNFHVSSYIYILQLYIRLLYSFCVSFYYLIQQRIINWFLSFRLSLSRLSSDSATRLFSLFFCGKTWWSIRRWSRPYLSRLFSVLSALVARSAYEDWKERESPEKLEARNGRKRRNCDWDKKEV